MATQVSSQVAEIVVRLPDGTLTALKMAPGDSLTFVNGLLVISNPAAKQEAEFVAALQYAIQGVPNDLRYIRENIRFEEVEDYMYVFVDNTATFLICTPFTIVDDDTLTRLAVKFLDSEGRLISREDAAASWAKFVDALPADTVSMGEDDIQGRIGEDMTTIFGILSLAHHLRGSGTDTDGDRSAMKSALRSLGWIKRGGAYRRGSRSAGK